MAQWVEVAVTPPISAKDFAGFLCRVQAASSTPIATQAA
jgi:hypothetical protein